MINSQIVTFSSYSSLDSQMPQFQGVPDYLAYIPRIINESITSESYESIIVKIAQEYAWQNSPIPMWSSVLKKLKYFESQYNKSSTEVFEAYKNNQGGLLGIPSRDLREWVNSYVMYAY